MIKAKEIIRIEVYKGIFSYRISSISSDTYKQFIGFFPSKEMFNAFKAKATEFLIEFNGRNTLGMYDSFSFSAHSFETKELDFEYFETVEEAIKSFNAYKLF